MHTIFHLTLTRGEIVEALCRRPDSFRNPFRIPGRIDPLPISPCDRGVAGSECMRKPYANKIALQERFVEVGEQSRCVVKRSGTCASRSRG